MLQTGFRAMMGVKIYGTDLREIERIGLQIEQLLREVPGATDIVADRIVGKPYIEIEIDRDRIARYGVNIRDVQDVIEIALGGVNLTESVEGRERYPIRIRLARDFREDADAIQRILVPTSIGAQVPLAQLADDHDRARPPGDQGRARPAGRLRHHEHPRPRRGHRRRGRRGPAPAGGQGRPPEASRRLLLGVVGAVREPGPRHGPHAHPRPHHAGHHVRDAVPGLHALVDRPGDLLRRAGLGLGGFIMLGLWGANLSVAVWVGFLVLFGVVDDDGVVMATYLEGVFKDRTFASVEEIRAAVLEAGLKRIRPCLMTTATTVFGLMPIFWATGRGSDVMQPMAIPSVGGMAVSLITLFIVPCVFCAVEEWKWKRERRAA